MVIPCSEVAMTDAEKESEARCKAMLNKLISMVKEQTVEMEALAVRLKATVQPLGPPAHALPLPVPAPTATLVTAVDHAVAAAAPHAEATFVPESPTKCSMIRACDDTASRTFAFTPDVAPGPPSTAAPIDVAITSPEPTDATVLVRDGTSVLANTQQDTVPDDADSGIPTSTSSGAAVNSIDLGDEHVPNLSSYQWDAHKVFDRMLVTDGISYGFSTNIPVLTNYYSAKSSTAGITVVGRVAYQATLLARFGNSCGATEFWQPWPPPAQVGVMSSGVEPCPTSWLSFKCYRGGRMVTPEEGFWPAINSTEVMCSFLPFGHVRMVSEGYESECSEDFDSVRQSWSLDEKILIQSLYKIIAAVSEFNPVILYIRDVNQFLASSERAYSMFQKMLKKLSGRVLIIGSYFFESDEDSDDVDEGVNALFPYILETKPPKEETHLEKWKTQMEDCMRKIQTQEVRNHIAEVLSANSLECDDLNSIDADEDFNVIANYIEEIMAPAVSYHLMNDKDPEYRNGKLIICSESLSQGLSIFQESNLGKDTVGARDEAKRDIPDNEYEKRIRPSVIPANEIGVTLDDIGALADIKESLQELVMLPLQQPDLFQGGGLLKPCRGILLFGPPGTGKTMLAKAILKDWTNTNASHTDTENNGINSHPKLDNFNSNTSIYPGPPIQQPVTLENSFLPNITDIDLKGDFEQGLPGDESIKSCQLEFGSYCLWSVEHKEVMKDSIVKRLKDQLFVARAYYPSIAKLEGMEKLSREMKQNIQEHEHMLSEAISDADIPKFYGVNMAKMDQPIAAAKSCAIECTNFEEKLRQLLDMTEDKAHFHASQSAHLYSLGVQTLPKSLHCLSMRLTVDYFKSFADMEYSDAQKLENPVLRHYDIFSTNLLASSMTINSTVINSEEAANEIFHLVTDAQNFYTFKNWFIRNFYKEATIGVLNFDDFQVKHLDSREVEHLSPSEAAKLSILIGLFKLLMTSVAVFKVDNLERRPLLIGGVGGIASSLFLLAVYYKILFFQQKRGGLLTFTLGKCVLLCAYKLKAQAGYLGAWEFQMTWDPGGLVLLPTSWHRLGDKPKFKEGGMLWTGSGLCPGLCVHGLDLVTAQVGGKGSIRAVATAARGGIEEQNRLSIFYLQLLPPPTSVPPFL